MNKLTIVLLLLLLSFGTVLKAQDRIGIVTRLQGRVTVERKINGKKQSVFITLALPLRKGDQLVADATGSCVYVLWSKNKQNPRVFTLEKNSTILLDGKNFGKELANLPKLSKWQNGSGALGIKQRAPKDAPPLQATYDKATNMVTLRWNAPKDMFKPSDKFKINVASLETQQNVYSNDEAKPSQKPDGTWEFLIPKLDNNQPFQTEEWYKITVNTIDSPILTQHVRTTTKEGEQRIAELKTQNEQLLSKPITETQLNNISELSMELKHFAQDAEVAKIIAALKSAFPNNDTVELLIFELEH